LIDDLTKLLPPKHLEEASSKCHRVNVLRGAVAHIKFLSDSNTGLAKTLDAAKSEGFKVPEVIEVVPSATASTDKDSAETVDQGVSMDVDMEDDAEANSVKQEDVDDDMKEVNSNSTPSRTSSPAISSSLKQSTSSTSPRLTPSKALGHPQLIVTNAPSPKTERPSSKEALVPPPISISAATADSNSLKSHPTVVSSISESTTPVSPAFPASPKSNPSTASSSPSARQGSFQAKDNSKQQLQQQLSPFMQTISLSTSPSLPPISSLASLKIQSPAARVDGGERHFEERPSSPTHRAAVPPSSANNNNKSVATHQRTGPTLPPLKIPAPQHLHPSYKQGAPHHSTYDSRASNRSGPTLSPHQHATSPHPQRGSEGEQHPQQPPVSPFMLSPLMSRSPSMGPLSASSAGASPYPHWGHEGSEGAGPPPPHHQGQYLPPHGYPHGYPYPYPYHPSYGYPHPPHGHPPPPHHHHPHHHHAPPSPHSPQQRPTSPYPAVATAPRPEPIFIQEEPWNVQRKRSTSATSGKAQSGKQSSVNNSKKAKEGSVIREEEEAAPVSPTSSVASTASSYPSPNNQRKRPSSSSHHHKGTSGNYEGIAEETTVKRVRQHDESSS
ncbi:hypothetical protein BGZ97_009042, partial [Linnemannia gamsii]